MKQLLYPCSIQELEFLDGRLHRAVETFSQDAPVAASALSKAVDEAFLLKNKVEAEARMLHMLFTLDTQRNSFRIKQQRLERHRKRHGKIPSKNGVAKIAAEIEALKKDIVKNKKKLREARLAVSKINNEIYQKSNPSERLYLENLACFKQSAA